MKRVRMSGELPVLVSVRALGSLMITVNGTVVDTLSSRRTRQVLAYLLLHGRAALPRDVLMDTFWPNASPNAARNSLHVALSATRQALRAACPDLVLLCQHATYRLAGADLIWLDVEEFKRHCGDGRRADLGRDVAKAIQGYAAADRLYEGDLLADDPYLSWVSPEREELRLEVLHAQRRLAELYAQRGDHAAAILVARRVLGIDPYDEAVHRRLMLEYREVGQLHLALAQYQRCADLLWQAFRIRPSPETVHLNEQLRRHQLMVTVPSDLGNQQAV